MARPLRVQYSGACYHVMARGQRREAIFTDDVDCARFLEVLDEALGFYEARLHAYCLMGNHYHAVLRTLQPNLSRLMHFVHTTYSGWWNHRHGKSGHLLGGRFKSPLVEDGSYLLAVSGYVHLNPVRTRAWKKRPVSERYRHAADWKWSSLAYYTRYQPAQRTPSVESDCVWTELGVRRTSDARQAYRMYIRGWLQEEERRRGRGVDPEKEEAFNPLLGVKRGTYLGGEAFGEAIEKLLGKERMLSTDISGHRDWQARDVKTAAVQIAEILQVDAQNLQRRSRDLKERLMAMALLKSACRTSNREVGEWFGVSGGAVGKALSRHAATLRKDRSYRRIFTKAEKSLIRYFET